MKMMALKLTRFFSKPIRDSKLSSLDQEELTTYKALQLNEKLTLKVLSSQTSKAIITNSFLDFGADSSCSD
jgi:hypothetical protein